EARLEYYKQSATLASLPTPSPTPTPAPARRAACGRAVADAGALPSPQEAQAVSQKREEALTQRDAAALQHDALIGLLGLLQNSANELRRGSRRVAGLRPSNTTGSASTIGSRRRC